MESRTYDMLHARLSLECAGFSLCRLFPCSTASLLDANLRYCGIYNSTCNQDILGCVGGARLMLDFTSPLVFDK
eukprot:6480955-Amphidinium_carterae.1